MDFQTQLRLTRELIDIDSTTGREAEAGEFLATLLRELGYRVVEQHVSEGRHNVVATVGDPVVVFSTHMDCVPPFVASRESGERLFGRGSTDAKGTILAQIAAAQRLRAAGETRVGLLYVVGEERGSDGAKLANTIAPPTCRFLIDGEPTENQLGRATRGVYRVRFTAKGRAAHSSQPERGESAIEKIVDVICTMRGVEWPEDSVLGRTFYTVGLMHGGVAPNVIPPEATAEAMFRTVGDWREVRAQLERHVGHTVTIDDVHVVPPVTLSTVPGFEPVVFPFTTDIPFLDAWGAPLLIGPGSVEMAHTADESVAVGDLARAVDIYAALASSLLSQTG